MTFAVATTPADLDPLLLALRLRTAVVGRRLLVRRSVPSTMTWAAALADDGAPDGTTVLADVQLAGRGRAGRTWQAGPGHAVLLSVILRAPADVPGDFWLSRVPMAAALGVLEGVGAVAPPRARLVLKWPNDLLALGSEGAAKVAGVLCEAHGLSPVVVGIGLNVAQRQGELPPGAASLRMLGVPVGRAAAATAVLNALDRWVVLLAAGYDPFPTWRARLHTLVRPVVVDSPAGRVTGTAVDVSPEGSLLVRLASGEVVSLHAGDVHLSGGRS